MVPMLQEKRGNEEIEQNVGTLTSFLISLKKTQVLVSSLSKSVIVGSSAIESIYMNKGQRIL